MSFCRCGRKSCRICELRKLRKQEVRRALEHGVTVPYEMRTLLEDGWSAGTIRKVYRSDKERERIAALERVTTHAKEKKP